MTSSWSGVCVINVAALIAEVEDMQKKKKNTVTTLWRLALTLSKISLRGCKPRLGYQQLTNHTVTTRGVWAISASGSDINHNKMRENFFLGGWFILQRFLFTRLVKDAEVTQRYFLCCASHLYWKSYHMYDTSLSSECSISATSLSSSVSFLSVIDS